jgi:hypothetical protein
VEKSSVGIRTKSDETKKAAIWRGCGAEQRSKYPYYDVLSFLLPVISTI